MIRLMKGALLLLLAVTFTLELSAQGQQQYFVYLQSDHAQPFYVRYDGKVLSSSDKGYLILSRLPAGIVVFRMGFAKSDVPEQQYHIRLTGQSDQGFMIKQDPNSGGYALYNLETFAMVKADQPKPKDAVADVPASVDAAVSVSAPAVDSAVAVVAATPAPAVVDSPAAKDTGIAPPVAMPAAPVTDSAAAMMAAVKKDMDAAFAGNPDVVVSHSRRPATVPVVASPAVKQPNKFSQALDKVLGDDHKEDSVVEEAPIAFEDSLATRTDSAVAVVPVVKKGRKKHNRDREPLTDEEQQILSDVMAQEKKAGEADSLVQASPVNVDAATAPPAEVAEVPEKKVKKSKKRDADSPDFIEFQDGSARQPAVAPAPVVTEDAAPVEDAPVKKKRRTRTKEAVDSIGVEHSNNVVTDSTGYALSDLSIDHPKKKRKKAEVDTTVAEAPVKSSLKMVNSDCDKTLDDDGYHKFLRKFVAAKDDDGMIEVFRKQTKGYCLETSQIKSLVQLLTTDDARYRLLDVAYPRAYDSEHFASLESVLTDDYYKGRFKAMLHK